MNQPHDPSIGHEIRRVRRHMLLATAALLLAGSVTTLAVGTSPETAAAATTAVNQCNADNTGAAREIRCDVTVVNNLDTTTGATSSSVTTTACAGAPGMALCVTTPGPLTTDIVASIDQCNGSALAGGSIVTCNVTVVNNVTGTGSTTPATVNQCIGSGQGGGIEPTTICVPASSVTGADITQCNGSGNGGGGTGRVTCTVLTSTVSALWSVTINQCNGSANGGGDLVTCTAQITTNLLAPQAVTTTTDAGSVITTGTAGTATTIPGATTPTGGATTPTTGATATVPNATAPPEVTLPATGGTATGTATGFLLASLLTAVGIGALVASRRRAI